MAGIKRLNSTKPGVFRPVQASDLQDIWDGLANALASDTITLTVDDTKPAAEVRIISGMHVTDGGFITSGVVAYKGELYYYDGDTELLQVGENLYLHKRNGPDRTLADGSVIPFYILNTVNNVSVEGVPIGTATEEQLNAWRMPLVPDGGITEAMIANGAVTQEKIANGAVTQEKIANGAVGYDQIVDGGVGGIEKVDNIPTVRSPIGFTSFQTTAFPNASFIPGERRVYTVIRQADVTIEKPLGLSLTGVNIMYIRNTYSSNITITLPSDVVGDTSFQLPANKTAKIVASIATGEFSGDTVYEVTILDAFCYSQV